MSYDVSTDSIGTVGGRHAGSTELKYRCVQCDASFELDSAGGTAASIVFTLGALVGGAYCLLQATPPVGSDHWRSDLVFLAVIGLVAGTLASVRIATQVLRRVRHPMLQNERPGSLDDFRAASSRGDRI